MYVVRRLLTILQAAASIGVSRRTIYNWLHDGKLEFVRTAGGQIRIYEDTLVSAPKTELPMGPPSANRPRVN